MPFVLDATVGTATANSYATLAEANTYFAGHFSSSAWDGASDQEVLLSYSSRLLDHFMDWNGVRVENEELQAMDWPRDEVYGVDVDIVPQRVKNAVFELANYLAANGTNVDLAEASKIKVGPISIDIDADGAGFLLPPQISRILSNLGSPKSLPKNGVAVAKLVR